MIENSLQTLYCAFGPKHLKSFNENFILGSSADDIFREPIIGTQRKAKRIAAHYRLPVTTVIVTFNSSLQPPGRVELSNSNEFFVELQSQFRSNPKAIGAVLAHEVAHIFLHRCGVRFPDELNNEVLTDTTAAYVGFGPTIMNGVTETTRHLPSNVIQTNTHHFGYLSLDEFGYILAKRDSLFEVDSTSMIDSGIASTTFACGRDLNQRQLHARPFVTRPWY